MLLNSNSVLYNKTNAKMHYELNVSVIKLSYNLFSPFIHEIHVSFPKFEV